MPIGKIGVGSVPDLNALDSNPQSVAATGSASKVGEIGHRAVQWLSDGLRSASQAVREVADNFAQAIENRFSGSAKDNFKSLLHRSSVRTQAPIELKSFKPSLFVNATYGELPKTISSEYAQAVSSGYASLSDIDTKTLSKSESTDEYVSFEPSTQTDEYVSFEPSAQTDEYVSFEPSAQTDEYIEFDPSALYSSLSEISTESFAVGGQLADTPLKGLESFQPDACVPADTQFYAKVKPNSSPALKESLNFIRQVIAHHGAAGGKALVDAGILSNKEVIGQITPELLKTFETKLKEVKAAFAAKVATGFGQSAGEVRFEKFNSENADSPIHAVLEKAVFASAPKLANKTKWEFDRALASGASGAQPSDIAESIARQVLGEELKESFDAGRSDSPLHDVLARSTLANSSAKKLENIKAGFDQALRDAAVNYAYEGGLDKPFNAAAFAQTAVSVAHATIAKYSF
jgi:hypothetical protein